jgi:hypothetical protein
MLSRRLSHLKYCWWPGLPSLWLRGDFLSVVCAMGFAMLLNTTLLGTFCWPRLFDDQMLPLLQVATLSWWIGAGIWSFWKFPLSIAAEARAQSNWDDVFVEAQDEFLRGHFAEAGHLVRRIIAILPNHVEARLLLVSILRKTERWTELRDQLIDIERYDAAAVWRFEIAREWEWLEQAEEAATEPEPGIGSAVQTKESHQGPSDSRAVPSSQNELDQKAFELNVESIRRAA